MITRRLRDWDVSYVMRKKNAPFSASGLGKKTPDATAAPGSYNQGSLRLAKLPARPPCDRLFGKVPTQSPENQPP